MLVVQSVNVCDKIQTVPEIVFCNSTAVIIHYLQGIVLLGMIMWKLLDTAYVQMAR